jgi:hypothetical protein
MVPLRGIRQVELTSRCNLRCAYCPSPKMQDGEAPFRPAVDMTDDDFAAAMDVVGFFVRAGSQEELNLAGIGESTLHPKFVEWAFRAREVIGPRRLLTISSNGLLITEKLAAELAPTGIQIGVSLHVGLKRAQPAIVALKKHGIFQTVSYEAANESISWAGQVDWPDASVRFPCHWLIEGHAMVMADGRLTPCCLDATGAGDLGHVSAARSRLAAGKPFYTAPFGLCRTCHHVIPEFTQAEASRDDTLRDGWNAPV